MTREFSRFLGWSLALQNFLVAALVAWALALVLLVAQAAVHEVVRIEEQSQIAAVSHGLGFVGMATAPQLAGAGYQLLASGTPGRRWTP